MSNSDRSWSRLAEASLRCLACGRAITTGQRVFRIHGLPLHLRCAVYRRRRLRELA